MRQRQRDSRQGTPHPHPGTGPRDGTGAPGPRGPRRHAVGRVAAIAAVLLLAAHGTACGGAADEAPDTGADVTGRSTGTEAAAPLRTDTGDPANAPADQAEADPAAATRAALPGLFGIMLGLQENMSTVSRGIWLADYAAIATGAARIAGHPTVPPDELRQVSEILGPDLQAFRGFDMSVHDLAVRLEEEARAGDLDAVLATDAALRRGCVACHAEFRERLRRGVADAGAS